MFVNKHFADIRWAYPKRWKVLFFLLGKLLCNFIEIALRHGCSPVNSLHIFRKLFSRNTSGWLLLSIGHLERPAEQSVKGCYYLIDGWVVGERGLISFKGQWTVLQFLVWIFNYFEKIVFNKRVLSCYTWYSGNCSDLALGNNHFINWTFGGSN